MKRSFLLVLLILNFLYSTAQTEAKIKEILNSTDNIGEIRSKLEKYPSYSASLIILNSEADKKKFDKVALSKKKGEIFQSKDKKKFYKIIESDSSISIKVRYIYFDGFEMEKKEIDKLRKELIQRLNKGESFEKLANEFTMDNNSSGQFGWISIEMVDKTFANTVMKHKKGDIFTIDVDENKWYYIVLKIDDDKISKTNMMFEIKKGK